MKLDYVAHSEIGLVRKNNQDSGYASPTMLVVADGMGGAAAGDLASAVAIDELRRADISSDDTSRHAERLADAVDAANLKIANLIADDDALDGMGTTVCGGMFDGTTLSLIHIGDSRGYLYRDGTLTRLTKDHTWVQSLVDDGKITPDEALYHPHRSLLLKVVNGHPANTCDTDTVELREGDRLLFCSDGLCGLVEDDVIAEDIAHESLDEVLDALVESAHEAGGLDNITIVMADVVPDDARAPRQPLLLGAAIDVDIPDLSPRPIAADAASKPTLVEDPEDARYRPIPRPKGRRRLWWLIAALVVAALAAAGSMAAAKVINARYYLGADDQSVAIYRGLPDHLGPLKLGSVFEKTPVQVSDLPPRYAEQVRTNYYKGLTLEAVRSTVSELDKKAEQCVIARRTHAQQTQAPVPTQTPTPTATPGTASPGSSASPSASPVTPTPTEQTPPPPPEEC